MSNCSTSSSANFSPSVVNKWRSSADEMKPLASLSKWRSPSMKSSAVSFDRCLEIAWNLRWEKLKLVRDKCANTTKQLLINLINWQENLKRYSLVGLELMCKLLDIRLGRILAESAKTLADLMLLNFAIATVVEEVEGLLELCGREEEEKKKYRTIKMWVTQLALSSGYACNSLFFCFRTFDGAERMLFRGFVHMEHKSIEDQAQNRRDWSWRDHTREWDRVKFHCCFLQF